MNVNDTSTWRRPLLASLTLVATFALAVALGVAVTGSAPAAGPPPGMGPGGHDEGTEEYAAPAALYRVAADGTGLVRLTQGPGYNTWSDNHANVRSDGAIVFSSTRAAPDGSTDAEVWMLLPDGTPVQLTNNTTSVSDETGEEEPVNDLNPAFSPDGTNVAYQSAPPASEEGEEEEGSGGGGPPGTSGLAGSQIWVVDVETKAAEPITLIKASEGAAKHPTWSPDGKRIAFTVGDGTRMHIVAIDLATKATTDVTPAGSTDSMPAWSPDSDDDVIAFTRGLGIGMDIYAVELVEGLPGTPYPLAATASEMESEPAWSPVGSAIAYQRGDESLGASIWLMAPDGTNQQRVTTATAWSDRDPAVAPDGTIVFESTQDAVPAADLRITKTGSPAAVVTGETVTYTIPVVNGGPLTATGVAVVDTLPAGMQYLSAAAVLTPSEHGEEEPEEPSFTPTASVAGNVVTVALGDLPKGERGSAVATVTIVAKATATGTLTNTAVVSLTPDDTNPDLVDPLPSNNTATASTSVTTSPGSPGGTTTTTTGSTPGGGPPQTPGRPPTTPGTPQPPAAGSAGALITGTAGNDVLVGTPRRDLIVAGGGNDRIAGLGGNDVIYGGPGNDTIYGGAGNDRLNGGAGDDALYGKAGNDAVYGGAGNDTLVHVRGEGVDRLFAGAGNDLLFARDGNRDWLNGGRGRDVARLDSRLDRTYSVERHR